MRPALSFKMADPFAALNSICISNLGGENVSYEAIATATTYTVTGLWLDGAEALARGDHAAVFFAEIADFSPYPLKGDRITRGGSVYQICEDTLNPANLAGIGGIYLVLRKVE